mmetsp:Transcript_49445/g.110885  ORF Transcript_49445/g.110885 Transcript_49445/m.110885 type:complete len:973 (-) Transcript_49445:71-2989(-)
MVFLERVNDRLALASPDCLSWLLTFFVAELLLCGVVTSDDTNKDFFKTKDAVSPRHKAIVQSMQAWSNVSDKPWSHKRVVAAMTTTPKRISQIEPALDSLLEQTRPLDKIYLFVPWIFLRDGSEYVVPPWLQQKAGITVVRCEDHGPSTHMVEVLLAERHPDTYILQVDDDQKYGPKLLDGLLHATGPLPGRAVGAATQHSHTQFGGGVVLEGVHGVLFQRRFFDSTVFDVGNFSRHCRLHDDLWLSAHLAKRGVARETVGDRVGTAPLSFGFASDALYNGGAGSDNNRNFYLCMDSLLRVQPRLWEREDRLVLAAPILPLGRRVSANRGSQTEDFLMELLQWRRPKYGLHALYLVGPIPTSLAGEVANPLNLQIDGGVAFHVGGWKDGIDIVIRECSLTCGQADALALALELEEDPHSIIIVVDEILPKQVTDQIISSHRHCYRRQKDATSRLPCRGEHGSISIKRHAAYPESRVFDAFFWPQFTQHHGHAKNWIGIAAMTQGLGVMWRDGQGDWREAYSHANDFVTLNKAIGADMQRQAEASQQRLVAVLDTSPKYFKRASLTIRSLFRQRRRVDMIYVLVHLPSRKPRKVKRCTPAWLGLHRVFPLCTGMGHRLDAMLHVLATEVHPDTLVLLCDDSHQYGSSFTRGFLLAANFWPGYAVSGSGVTKGQHGGPVPRRGSGILCKRSWLDVRIMDFITGPCAQDAEADLVLSAHLAHKGVYPKVIGRRFGTQALLQESHSTALPALDCYDAIVEHHPHLWSSERTIRAVAFVALLPGFDSHTLHMTIQLAGFQTTTADEVVLLAPYGSLSKSEPIGRTPAGDTEVNITGLLGDPEVTIHSRSRGMLHLDLHNLLSVLHDTVGCVVRMSTSPSARSWSFSLSVVECPTSPCGMQYAMAVALAREADPDTVLLWTKAERLVSEHSIEDTLRCLMMCRPHCSPRTWCGTPVRADDSIDFMAVRRSAGYHNTEL